MSRAEWKSKVLFQAAGGNWAALRHLRRRQTQASAMSSYSAAQGGHARALKAMQSHVREKFGHFAPPSRESFMALSRELSVRCGLVGPRLFTDDELCLHIAAMKPGKTSGADSVTPELLHLVTYTLLYRS